MAKNNKTIIIGIGILALLGGAILLSQKAKSTPPIISLKILVNGVQSQTAHVGDTLSTIWESQNYPDGSYVIILIKINGIPHEYTQHELPSDTITFIIEEDDFLPLPAIIELKAILYDIGGLFLATSNIDTVTITA